MTTPQAKTRSGTVAIVVAVLAMIALALTQIRTYTASESAHLEAGFAHMVARPAGLEEAHADFVDAARDAMFDPYPLFCVSLVEAMQGEAATAPVIKDYGPAMVSIKEGRYEEARTWLVSRMARHPEEQARASHWIRFATDLEVAEQRAKPPEPTQGP